MTAMCNDCHAPVRFERTIRGRKLILNAQPDRLGNVALVVTGDGTVARELSGARLTGWRGPLYLPHWATCPHDGRTRTWPLLRRT